MEAEPPIHRASMRHNVNLSFQMLLDGHSILPIELPVSLLAILNLG